MCLILNEMGSSGVYRNVYYFGEPGIISSVWCRQPQELYQFLWGLHALAFSIQGKLIFYMEFNTF